MVRRDDNMIWASSRVIIGFLTAADARSHSQLQHFWTASIRVVTDAPAWAVQRLEPSNDSIVYHISVCGLLRFCPEVQCSFVFAQ